MNDLALIVAFLIGCAFPLVVICVLITLRKRNPLYVLSVTFSEALFAKLRASQKKYGFHNNEWMLSDWKDECSLALIDHVAKGDPLDVAAYAAFCFHHGWSTQIPPHLERALIDKNFHVDSTQRGDFSFSYYGRTLCRSNCLLRIITIALREQQKQ